MSLTNSTNCERQDRDDTNRQPVAGVLTVFQTPFRSEGEGEVDENALQTELEWLFANGADGVVFAMVSEILRLSSDERDRVASVACRVAQGRGAAVISVGAESTAVAVRHARHAEACGASAIMATPPGLHRVSDDSLLGYFTAIAGSVSIPLVVQDASGYVGGGPLSIDLQSRLFAELGEQVMFKPESHPVGPRLSQLLDQTDGKAQVFEGSGGLYLIDSFRRGVVGTMPAGDLVWATAALWRALSTGDFSKAYRIGGPLAMIVSLQTSLDSYVATEKYLLVMQGVLSNAAMRGPVASTLDGHTREELDRLTALLREAVDSD